jgi:malate synthase
MARWIALVLALSAVLPAASAGPAPTIRGDPQVLTEVQAAQNKFASAKSWRSRMTMSVPGQSVPLPPRTTEFVAPDRTRMTWADGRGGTAGHIRIGGDSWTFGTGGCIKTASGVRPPGPDARDAVLGPSDATLEIAKGGRETVEGMVTQTYTRAYTTSDGQMREKLFVAVDSGYFRRIEIVVSRDGVTVTMTMDYVDYDSPITISPPC